MMRPLIKVTLYDATSENDCTLLEEDGEYFVNFANRTGTYREFLRMILLDERLYPDLVAGDAAASFFALMKAVSDQWNDRIKAEVLYAEPGGQATGNRRKPETKEMIIKRIVSGRPNNLGRTAFVQPGVVFWAESEQATNELSETRIPFERAVVGNGHGMRDAGRDVRLRAHRRMTCCGGRGGGAAKNALSVQKGGAKLVAMADVFENNLNTAVASLKRDPEVGGDVEVDDNKFLGFDAFKRAIDTLRKGDVAIFTTPLAFRWVHFQYAIEKGLNVFMEKPLTCDGPSSRRMLALAEQSVKKNLKVGVRIPISSCERRGRTVSCPSPAQRHSSSPALSLSRKNELDPGSYELPHLTPAPKTNSPKVNHFDSRTRFMVGSLGPAELLCAGFFRLF